MDPPIETQAQGVESPPRKNPNESNHVANRGRRSSGKKRKDLGRSQWTQERGNRREKIEESKRQRLLRGEDGKPIYATTYPEAEIAGEDRRPKKKVAVMVGYSGSGYKGMQINDKERTIEGDLFGAFVAAGAVSKANADDPKKCALVRCARTDKGVHAAGNLISMKLIVEDEHIVQKINNNLSPQIRVWGIERTNNSFSAYDLCESRIYEYLLPTYCFLPPHPKSFLSKSLLELANEAGDREGYEMRQQEVASFWTNAEKAFVDVLERLDPEIRSQALRVVSGGGTDQLEESCANAHEGSEVATAEKQLPDRTCFDPGSIDLKDASPKDLGMDGKALWAPDSAQELRKQGSYVPLHLEDAVRDLKSAYREARIAYRISPERLARVRSVLSRYVGTSSYHNYTPGRRGGDPSAKRHIISFAVAPSPLLIHGTEWLSLKVHGQSFMMHQIRKMVSMAMLMVRCGTHEARIQDSFELDVRLSIPTAPGLGLLLEQPIFNEYNDKLRFKGGIERAAIGFEPYQAEIDSFKQREIYERIFREEACGMVFQRFLDAVDALKSTRLLYLSSLGIDAISKELGGCDGGEADEQELFNQLDRGKEGEFEAADN